jgi:hypothetical protein
MSSVRYELGVYISEDDILKIYRFFCIVYTSFIHIYDILIAISVIMPYSCYLFLICLFVCLLQLSCDR